MRPPVPSLFAVAEDVPLSTDAMEDVRAEYCADNPAVRLARAVEGGRALGRTALYFGCWDRPGHYLYGSNGVSIWGSARPADLPWDDGLMDSTLLRNGKIEDEPNGNVYWTCGGKDAFWYAFYWWDRSVDGRGACNSGFYVRGFGYPEVREAFDWACSQFPKVVARQKFPLELQLNWRKR